MQLIGGRFTPDRGFDEPPRTNFDSIGQAIMPLFALICCYFSLLAVTYRHFDSIGQAIMPLHTVTSTRSGRRSCRYLP